MNAKEITTIAKSLGFTKVRAISDGFNAGGVFVWLWNRGQFSRSSDDAYLFFKNGFVEGPKPGCQSVWSNRPCVDIGSVKAELLSAKNHKLTSHIR